MKILDLKLNVRYYTRQKEASILHTKQAIPHTEPQNYQHALTQEYRPKEKQVTLLSRSRLLQDVIDLICSNNPGIQLSLITGISEVTLGIEQYLPFHVKYGYQTIQSFLLDLNRYEMLTEHETYADPFQTEPISNTPRYNELLLANLILTSLKKHLEDQKGKKLNFEFVNPFA